MSISKWKGSPWCSKPMLFYITLAQSWKQWLKVCNISSFYWFLWFCQYSKCTTGMLTPWVVDIDDLYSTRCSSLFWNKTKWSLHWSAKTQCKQTAATMESLINNHTSPRNIINHVYICYKLQYRIWFLSLIMAWTECMKRKQISHISNSNSKSPFNYSLMINMSASNFNEVSVGLQLVTNNHRECLDNKCIAPKFRDVSTIVTNWT